MNEERNKFYITTSIPYVNSVPHIGFALELVQADSIARFHQLIGDDVFFLTGTSEHGSKVPKAAEAAGRDIMEFVSDNSGRFKALAAALQISNTHFIRTTDQGHHKTVEKFWNKLLEKGDIYKDRFEGLYCVGCESYKTDSDLVDGKCPIHKTTPEKIAEENYFFRWSKYQKMLEELFEKNFVFVKPKKWSNEVEQFIKQGVKDISISRSKKSLTWGVSVPGDKDQVVYVWFDELLNYLSGIGYYEEDGIFEKYWPADVHLIGKDITRFHAAFWPAMLTSADLPLPKQILVHGFVSVSGEKISKSLGNVIDPIPLIEKYGADAVRYFLLREIPSDGDGDFTEEKFVKRYTAELANDLGNLVSRVTNLLEKNCDGVVPQLVDSPKKSERLEENIRNFKLHDALSEIWENIAWANQYVDKSKLWELPKKDKKLFDQVISSLVALLKQVSIELSPFLPETADKLDKILNSERIEKSEPLFPRIETAK